MLKLRIQTGNEHNNELIADIEKAEKETAKAYKKLEQSESYTEQARAMIEIIMEKWYHYDID